MLPDGGIRLSGIEHEFGMDRDDDGSDG